MKLTPHFKPLMSPEDQARYFGEKAEEQMTLAQVQTKYAPGSERTEQRTFYNWLLLHEREGELVFDWSRTDRPTTRRLGALDFVIYASGARPLFIEFKSEGAKLRPEQERQVETLRALGFRVEIVHSALSAIELTQKHLAK